MKCPYCKCDIICQIDDNTAYLVDKQTRINRASSIILNWMRWMAEGKPEYRLCVQTYFDNNKSKVYLDLGRGGIYTVEYRDPENPKLNFYGRYIMEHNNFTITECSDESE